MAIRLETAVRLVSLVGSVVAVAFFGAQAFAQGTTQRTNCDSFAKPALDCPIGYYVGCVPVGGYHWSCVKDVQAPKGSIKGNTITLPPSLRGSTPPTVSQSFASRVIATTTVNPVSVAAREIRGWNTDDKVAFLQTVKAAVQVRTDAELENFARGVLVSDPEVKSVSINSERTHIRYETRARFLAVLPVSLSREIIIMPDGKVSIHFPWYAMFFRTAHSANSETLETALRAEENFATLPDNPAKRALMLGIVINTLAGSNADAVVN